MTELTADLWDLIYGWQLFPITVIAVLVFVYFIKWIDNKAQWRKPFRVHFMKGNKNIRVGDIINSQDDPLLVLEYDYKTGVAWVTRDLDHPASGFWRLKK